MKGCLLGVTSYDQQVAFLSIAQTSVRVLLCVFLCGVATSQPVNIGKDVCRLNPPKWFPEFDKLLNSTELVKGRDSAQQLFHTNAAEFKRQFTTLGLRLYTEFLPYAFSAPILNETRPYSLQLNCSKSKFSTILTGEQRPQPVKIAWASHLDSEAHLLRLRLYTYNDLVDHWLIAESIRTQRLGTFKPLMFDRFKHKLQPFLDKVTHFVLDSTRATNPNSDQVSKEDWKGEIHERAVFYKFLHNLDFMSDDDLLVYGDLDELADEDYLYHLKHCSLKPDLPMPLNSNAPFYKVDYRFLFQNDHVPSSEFPYSLKFPQIWRYGYIRQNQGLKLRVYHPLPGETLRYPLEPGGAHYAYYGFLPSLYLAKGMNIAETEIGRFFGDPAMHSAVTALAAFSEFTYRPHWRVRVPHPDCIQQRYPMYKEFLLRAPWLAVQNPEAFPEFMVCDKAFYDTVPGFKNC
jgi:hypothetical protein